MIQLLKYFFYNAGRPNPDADHTDFAQSQHLGPELANSSPTTSAKRAQTLKTAHLQYNDKVFNTVNKIDR